MFTFEVLRKVKFVKTNLEKTASSMDEASVLSNIVARDAPDAVKAALAQAIRGTASIAEDVALLEENRLWVGNWRSVQLLEQLKCQAVLNCALAVETPTVVACDAFLRLSMPDAPHPALDVRPFLRDGAKFIDEQHKLNRCVLVHCLGGQNRSTSVCAAFLILYRGWGAEKAMDFVASRRNICLINPVYKQALRTL